MSNKRGLKPKFTDDKWVYYYKNGQSDVEISKRIGVSPGTICNWRKKLDLPAIGLPGKQSQRKRERIWLIDGLDVIKNIIIEKKYDEAADFSEVITLKLKSRIKDAPTPPPDLIQDMDVIPIIYFKKEDFKGK